ncbi:Universal stress protein F [Planctomycetes bacterium Pan216]|uniref:Universal stress protein F n=1 Tax=Kolteria novifilia TaxID=2527975 RepID=A0A518BBY2_9BACT|nr:Universal stress protein F [Planctomycetes bacterium Pan216]
MNRILVPIDFSLTTQAVVNAAIQAARLVDGEVFLLHVAPSESTLSAAYEAGLNDVRHWRAEDILAEHRQIVELAQRFEENGVKATALLIQGKTVDKILSKAESLHATLIIMASHGHGALYDLMVGSTAEGVLRKASVPVLIIPPNAHNSDQSE